MSEKETRPADESQNEPEKNVNEIKTKINLASWSRAKEKTVRPWSSWASSIAAVFSAAAFGSFWVAWNVQSYQEEKDSVTQYQVAVRTDGKSWNDTTRAGVTLHIYNGTPRVMAQIEPAMPASVGGILVHEGLGSLAPGESGEMKLEFSLEDWRNVENCNLGISYTNPISATDFSEKRYAFMTSNRPSEQQTGNLCSLALDNSNSKKILSRNK